MTHARNRMLFRFVGIVVWYTIYVTDCLDCLISVPFVREFMDGTIRGWGGVFYFCSGTHYELKIGDALLHLAFSKH